MEIKYLIDSAGNKVAVVVPIEDWETIWEQLTDDEVPLTEEDWEAIKAGEEGIARGEFLTAEQFKDELGL